MTTFSLAKKVVFVAGMAAFMLGYAATIDTLNTHGPTPPAAIEVSLFCGGFWALYLVALLRVTQNSALPRQHFEASNQLGILVVIATLLLCVIGNAMSINATFRIASYALGALVASFVAAGFAFRFKPQN